MAMQRARTRTRTLTIYLLKQGTPPRAVLLERDELVKLEVRIGSRRLGDLYVKPPRSSTPRWLSLFAGYASIDSLRIRNASSAAVLLVRRQRRLLAITFGYGRHLLAPGVWEENFGLRTTLNMVDSERIRSIDRKRFDAIARHTREQGSVEGSIAQFGLDVEQDLLRALVGTPRDTKLGKRIAGMDALTPTVALELSDLPGLLDQYLQQSRRRAYRKTFPWVDHIGEVRDPRIRDQLDQELVERLISGSAARCWLAVPDPINWAEVGGFLYTTRRNEEASPDLHLRDFMATIRPSTELSADYLRHRHVSCVGLDTDQVRERWTIYQCLYAEVDVAGETYLLTRGSWYRVSPDFVRAVNQYVQALPQPRIDLPFFSDRSETEYNKRVRRLRRHEFALMDGKNISYGGGPSRIEFCDLYSRSRVMLHVKRYMGSSVLSHLFAQGLVSAQAFIQSVEFRQKVDRLLPDSHRLPDPARRPRADSYEVAYGIISRSPRPLDLPFFSKVNLRNAAQQLRTLGFRVSLVKIPAGQADDA